MKQIQGAIDITIEGGIQSSLGLGVAIKEMIDEGIITVEYCATPSMLSDLFTKNLNHILFDKFAAYVTGYATERSLLFVFKAME